MDKKIDLIIFSMDRACQLEALLRSIKRNCDIFEIKIVYNCSTDRFKQGYEKLIASDTGHIEYWIRESGNFQEKTLHALSQCREDFISFSTDDTVMTKKVDLNALQAALPAFNNQVFSFRLGYNTIEQDIHRGTRQPPLNQHVNHGNWLSWDINKYHPHENYGYPFGLDLHVFRTDLIRNLLSSMEFCSTNQIEGNLTTHHRNKIDEMRCFPESVAVNIPINTVTGVTIAGKINPISKEELNEKWLNNEIIDLEDIENTSFKGCHSEKQFKFARLN